MQKKRLLPDETIRQILGSKKNANPKERQKARRELKHLWLKKKYPEFVKPAQLLEIAPITEREEAFKKGKMVFYFGKKQIFFKNFLTNGEKLVMPVVLDGQIYTVRFDPNVNRLVIFKLDKSGKETKTTNFVNCDPNDMAHLILNLFEKRGLAIPLLRIATQHAVAVNNGKAYAPDVFLERFLNLFQRVGYKIVSKRKIDAMELLRNISAGEHLRQFGANYDKAKIMLISYDLEFTGTPKKENNLLENFRFIAYSPETGKIESFYFS